jgi:uracil-DNA glycosylase
MGTAIDRSFKGQASALITSGVTFNLSVRENDVKVKNCVNFKRKYGSTPVIRKINNVGDWSKRQWEIHYKIITFVVASTPVIIGILLRSN